MATFELSEGGVVFGSVEINESLLCEDDQELLDKIEALELENAALKEELETLRGAMSTIDEVSDQFDTDGGDEEFEPDITVAPGDSITAALIAASNLPEKTEDRKARVLLQPGNHLPFHWSGITNVHLKFSEGALIEGMIPGDMFVWSASEVDGVIVSDYPGFADLWTWQGNHPANEDAYNNARMYPLLLAIDDEPILWQPGGIDALAPGEFWVDSAPDVAGKIYMKLTESQNNGTLTVSPYPRLMWGDELTSGNILEKAYFHGCSNTGKTGAVNFSGGGWDVRYCQVDLSRTIGIEFGQGGEKSNMRGIVSNSTFIGAVALRSGQQGMWGALHDCELIDCGHMFSNWGLFDIWWEASIKFENTHRTRFIDFFADQCKGPGLWFDGVTQNDGGGNTSNEIIGYTCNDCVRVGLELELGTSNTTVREININTITLAIYNPDKPWGVNDAIIIKAFANGNTIEGGTVSDVDNVVRLQNEDERGVSDNNTISGIVANDYGELFQVEGPQLNNQYIT